MALQFLRFGRTDELLIMAKRTLVSVVMGSASDWETMQHCVAMLEEFGVPNEHRIVSAHRTPDLDGEVCQRGRRAWGAGNHRRGGRRGSSARDDRRADLAAGAWRAGRVARAQGTRLAPLHRANAGRRCRRYSRDRRGGGEERRTSRGQHRRITRRKNPRGSGEIPTTPDEKRSSRKNCHDPRAKRFFPARQLA